jgi:hypothetical protein
MGRRKLTTSKNEMASKEIIKSESTIKVPSGVEMSGLDLDSKIIIECNLPDNKRFDFEIPTCLLFFVKRIRINIDQE